MAAATNCSGSLSTALGGIAPAWGVVFDVQTLRMTVNLTGIDLFLALNEGEGARLAVYTKRGSFLDGRLDLDSWTIQQRVSVASRFPQSTPLPKWDQPIQMQADTVQAFYVTGFVPNVLYTTQTQADVGEPSLFFDAELQILVGLGVGEYPLSNNATLVRSRIFTGALHYQVVPCTQDQTNPPTTLGSTLAPSWAPLLSERDVLGILYKFTDGPNWLIRTGWEDRGVGVCERYGVVCNSEGRVAGLTLENNFLVGTTPPELFQLTFLERLSLDGNPVDFVFRGIQRATALQSISIRDTNTTSLQEIGQAPNLSSLIAENADISGTIPDEVLFVRSLEYLQLGRNSITGTIPPNIGRLFKLEYLDLSENKLSGTIPSELTLLTSLNTLLLSSQSLTGSLPSFPLLLSIATLDLSNNLLRGPIPDNLLEEVSDLTRPIDLILDNNFLTGQIPESLSRFDNLSIFLRDNRITGIPDAVCEKSGWMGGTVADFGCEAILCCQGTFNEIGRQDSRENPCRFCSTAQYCGATACDSSSPLTLSPKPTPSPSSITPRPTSNQLLTERQALEVFFRVTRGETSWKNTQGWTVDGFPVCEWFGVSCGSRGQVIGLALDNNGLVGSTPSELYHLQDLERLVLSNNDVDVIFYGIELAPSLRSMLLSNTQTRSVEGIGEAQRLMDLNLDRTLITSQTAEELGKVETLQVLDVGYNSLNGPLDRLIPPSLSNLRIFSAPESNITGTIAFEIGLLSQLRYLDISDNNLEGRIPDEINRLELLDTLYLQSNDFRGSLPPFDNLSQLTDLVVSNNFLSGFVPLRLLSSVPDSAWKINVDLSSNMLTGTMPDTLARFELLNIDLTDNKINTIPDELCQKSQWMDGNVRLYGCDAIMCPPGTFNEHGRQIANAPCLACPIDEDEPTQFFGSVVCISATPRPTASPRPVSTFTPKASPSPSSLPINPVSTFSPSPTVTNKPRFITCPDGRACFNGGQCQRTSISSDDFFCDCTAALDGGLPHTGRSCEYEATSLCIISGRPPYTSFCSNGGTCIELVQPGQLHAGCICSAEFFGAFCQFPSNSKDKGGSEGNSGSDTLDWWIILLIVLIPTVLLGTLVVLGWRRAPRSSNPGEPIDRDVEASVGEGGAVEPAGEAVIIGAAVDTEEGGVVEPAEATSRSDSVDTEADIYISEEETAAAGFGKEEEEKTEAGPEDRELPKMYGQVEGGCVSTSQQNDSDPVDESSYASDDDKRGDPKGEIHKDEYAEDVSVRSDSEESQRDALSDTEGEEDMLDKGL